MLENVITTKEDITIEDAIKTLFKKHVGALEYLQNAMPSEAWPEKFP